MRRTLFIGLGLVFLLSGCTGSGSVQGAATDQPPVKEIKTYSKRTIVLNALNGSPYAGKAVLEKQGEDVHVTIRVEKASAVLLPVNLHLGTCAAPRDIKYPLKPVDDGNSDTILKKTTIAELKDLAIVVYSADENPAPAACGIITIEL